MDIVTDADTNADQDTCKETNEGVDGGPGIRISLSPKENHAGCGKKRLKSQVQ